MGFSRATFYRFAEGAEEAVLAYVIESPAHGQVRARMKCVKKNFYIPKWSTIYSVRLGASARP